MTTLETNFLDISSITKKYLIEVPQSAFLVFVLVVVSVFFCVQPSYSQCNCTSSCITSTGSGQWNDCNTWTGVSCFGWSTATIMENRQQVINSSHTVTVPSFGVSSNHAKTKGIYVYSNGILNIGSGLDGGFSAFDIEVCGTLNVTGGTSTFNSATLTVFSGGVINISGGKLEITRT